MDFPAAKDVDTDADHDEPLEIGAEAEHSDSYGADHVTGVWLNVIEKLDPKDKHAFLGACAEWHQWMDSKRPMDLFPQVAPILLTSLPQNDVLQSRSLCRSWTKDLLIDFDISEPLPTPCNVFRTAAEIQQFLDEMSGRGHLGNPFPGGNIRLELTYPTNLREQFGTHVLNASVTASIAENTRSTPRLALLTAVVNCLNHLPNVKRLFIKVDTGLTKTEILNYFESHPLNPLQHLEGLELKGDRYDWELLKMILKSCVVPNQLKGLFMESNHYHNIFLSEIIPSLHNLEVLKFKANPYSVADFCSLRWEKLSPLRELELDILSFYRSTDLNFSSLFTALEAFRETLVHLSLTTHSESSVFGEDFIINLPKLKTLSFYNYNGSLEPLKQLGALIHLTIIKFDFTGCMYDSNIWEFIPSLQTLTVGEERFERLIYEEQKGAARAGN